MTFSDFSLAILDIKYDSVTEYIIGNEVIGIGNYENKYSLLDEGDIYNIGDTYYFDPISINSDSLILKSFDKEKPSSYIFKRLPPKPGTKEWVPTNKVYKFRSLNSEEVVWDFINDSILLEHNMRTEDFSIIRWESVKLNHYPFMILTNVYHYPVLIDSVANQKVFVSTFESSINRFIFELDTPNEVSKDILGKWAFTKLEPIGSSTPTAPIDKMSWLNISKDSVEYEVYGLIFKDGWRASNTGEFITRNSSPIRFNTVWRVDSITKEKLVLELRDEINQKWRLIYNK